MDLALVTGLGQDADRYRLPKALYKAGGYDRLWLSPASAGRGFAGRTATADDRFPTAPDATTGHRTIIRNGSRISRSCIDTGILGSCGHGCARDRVDVCGRFAGTGRHDSAGVINPAQNGAKLGALHWDGITIYDPTLDPSGAGADRIIQMLAELFSQECLAL